MGKQARWRVETYIVFCTFCHPEATSPMTCRGVVWLSAPFVMLRLQARWHAGVLYGYPHLFSTRGERARWRAETNIVSCTFRQPGANKPVDTQRLTSSSAPFVIPRRQAWWHAGVPYGYLHLFLSRGGKPDDMQGYRMVIRIFRQPGANKPVDAQRLTSSSAHFVIPRRQARWHAGVSYGYPHLLSIRANEPVDTWRLASSSTLSVILTREVRWCAEIHKWLSAQMNFVNPSPWS